MGSKVENNCDLIMEAISNYYAGSLFKAYSFGPSRDYIKPKV